MYDLCNDHNSDQYLTTTKELQMLVGRKAKKFTAELVQSITTLTLVMPEEPESPGDAAGVVTITLWKQALVDCKDRTQVYDDFKAYVYNVVLGQSSDALQDRLKSHEHFPAAMQNGLALLRIIKTITYNFEERRNLVDAVGEVKEKFYVFKQGQHTTLQRHYEAFDCLLSVMNEVGIDIVDPIVLSTVAANNGHAAPTADDHREAKQLALAGRFIRSTNAKHETYLKELRHSQLNGHDDYPRTLSNAYNVLQRREPDVTPAIHHEGVAFLCAGTNGITHPRVTCHKCRK
jgi:chorismate mutase